MKSGKRSLYLCRLVCAALVATNGAFAVAQKLETRFPLTSDQILAAMQSRELPTDGVKVILSAPITSAVSAPVLEIQTITLLNTHTAQLKMSCRSHKDCLPFYVNAVWPETSPDLVLPGSGKRDGRTRQTESQLALSSASSSSTQTTLPATLRAGSSATLMMDHERVHIRLRVVCLDGGTPGDKVRVTTPDRKQAYVAEIVTPTLLKGSF